MGDKRIYGEAAIDLLRELKTSDRLEPFNEELRKQVVSETNALFKATENILKTKTADIVKKDPATVAELMVHHHSTFRNKQCMLAYLMERIRRLERIRWEVGVVIPQDLKVNPNTHEMNFFSGYDRLLGSYMRSLRGLDLTANLQHPPKDLFIEVRVLEDLGTIVTESGPITLRKNTQTLMRRSEAESLIRQGKLEHIDS